MCSKACQSLFQQYGVSFVCAQLVQKVRWMTEDGSTPGSGYALCGYYFGVRAGGGCRAEGPASAASTPRAAIPTCCSFSSLAPRGIAVPEAGGVRAICFLTEKKDNT